MRVAPVPVPGSSSRPASRRGPDGQTRQTGVVVVAVVVWIAAVLATALGIAVVRSRSVLGVVAGLLLFVLAAGFVVVGTFLLLVSSSGASSP